MTLKNDLASLISSQTVLKSQPVSRLLAEDSLLVAENFVLWCGRNKASVRKSHKYRWRTPF